MYLTARVKNENKVFILFERGERDAKVGLNVGISNALIAGFQIHNSRKTSS